VRKAILVPLASSCPWL